ncbi:MAG: BlaI/MecI/CopY family transcriptional regulator [Thermoplasmata archaeon]|nr:BlaI/MecI/CopY family transcriptional regulator [Thermoplasmata archaeon]
MADEDLEDQIKSLADKMESLEESMRMVATPYSQLLEYIERFQKISSSYFRLIDLYQRYGEISPDLLVPGVKDSISREIVKILFDRDGQNISQITQRLKERRGTSSRRTVRERLKELQEKGVVVSRGSERAKIYWLTEGYVKKWYELLGLGLGKDEQGE